jgi:antitoxin component YwqK of YwqJK toxin-antitoxin module
MVRKLTLPVVRIAFGMAIPLVSSWAIADDLDSENPSPAPAVAIADEDETASDSSYDNESSADATTTDEDSSVASTSDEEPGSLPEAAQEPTLAPVGENADSDSALDSDGKNSDSDSTQTEIIRERYPNTAIKIERHVGQDADGNYFNHGLYTHFDEKGRVIGTGEFRQGKRQGKWQRWFAANEGPMFSGPMFKEFQGPFASEVTFLDDQLHGIWRVFDGKGRKASDWEFAHGKPHGKSTWYYPNGKVRREIVYKEGEIDGEVIEYALDTKVSQRDKYIEGRRLALQTDWYAPGQKRAEGWTLFARDIAKPNYSWWDGVTTITVTGKDGVNQRHGEWTWWHKNGQKQMEGRYVEDAPVGKFVWWYANGQKQLEGEYIEGKQQGKFVWWHENGQKQLEGVYENGTQIGKWVRWNTEGKVAEVGDFGTDGQRVHVKTVDDGSEEGEDAPSLNAVTPHQSAPATPRFKR